MENAMLPLHSRPLRDLQARIERIRDLWAELMHTDMGSPAFELLIEQIRAESDVYRALFYEWRTSAPCRESRQPATAAESEPA
jgi:hypothetical protein